MHASDLLSLRGSGHCKAHFQKHLSLEQLWVRCCLSAESETMGLLVGDAGPLDCKTLCTLESAVSVMRSFSKQECKCVANHCWINGRVVCMEFHCHRSTIVYFIFKCKMLCELPFLCSCKNGMSSGIYPYSLFSRWGTELEACDLAWTLGHTTSPAQK